MLSLVYTALHSLSVFQECVGEALGGLKERLELPLAHIWCGLAFWFLFQGF